MNNTKKIFILQYKCGDRINSHNMLPKDKKRYGLPTNMYTVS